MAEVRVQVRRAYDEPEPGDGARVLVDRIWPRGLTKAKAALDEWCKHVAPSDELRKWYGHDPGRPSAYRASAQHGREDRRGEFWGSAHAFAALTGPALALTST